MIKCLHYPQEVAGLEGQIRAKYPHPSYPLYQKRVCPDHKKAVFPYVQARRINVTILRKRQTQPRSVSALSSAFFLIIKSNR